jgi:hypothetical protein
VYKVIEWRTIAVSRNKQQYEWDIGTHVLKGKDWYHC